MTDQPATDSCGASDLVPMELPPIAADLLPVLTTVRGLSALPRMPLLWFVPKRMGPLLAGAGWHAAILASLIGIALGLGLMVFEILRTFSVPYGQSGILTFNVSMPKSDLSVAEAVRAPFVSLATLAHTLTGMPVTSGMAFLIIAMMPIGLLALAAVMMPLAAAGERLGLLFGRCLRLVLWGMTTLIPLGVASFWWPAVLDEFKVAGRAEGIGTGPMPFVSDREQATIFALALFALWWLYVLWRSGLRYTGPADGPAWQPRTPRCQKCGYMIATLRLDACCPECSYTVAKSMAHLQRESKPTRWRLFTASFRDALPFTKER